MRSFPWFVPQKLFPGTPSPGKRGWRAFCICGVLDFSLVGILAKISKVLCDHKIGLFAVSSFNTDYILVTEAQFAEALQVLAKTGCQIKQGG